MANVELGQVSKVFSRGVTALRDVNLAVRSGEILVLLGPNGSGKSTLLRLIAGLERPSSGEIRIDGRVVDRLPPHQREVAMLFQSCVLYPHLTVERNIAFGLDGRFGGWLTRLWRGLANRKRMPGSNPRDVRERVRQTAKIVGVEHLLERYPRQLSGGERQRVALARVFVRQPAVFLLDEPWSNVDVRMRRGLRCELRALRQRTNASTILVTHDHAEALALGDRIAVLHQGRVHQVGTPAEILDDPRTRFVAEFAGKLANFVPGRLRSLDSGRVLEADAWSMRSPRLVSEPSIALTVADRPVWVAFEPLDIKPDWDTRNGDLSFSGIVIGSERVAEGWQVLIKSRGEAADGDDGVLAARVDEESRVHLGQSIRLTVGLDQVRVFDRETENRIHLGLERAK